MIVPRLKTLVIENFRSLRGKLVIPLDAQVVLIHGTNGMGKTSVLSALELALTGKIAHLAVNGNAYRDYLTTLDTGGGSIQLSTTRPHKDGSRVSGSLNFSDVLFEPRPLLDDIDADFFSERCYLPQATLGRLLEIYDDQKTDTSSPLTQFVKELLGLEPLDALVDGLYPAYHVTRVKNLVPKYRRLDSLRTSLRDERARLKQLVDAAKRGVEDRVASLNAILAKVPPAPSVIVVGDGTKLSALRTSLELARDEDRVLTDLHRRRSELIALLEAWQMLSVVDTGHDRATKERRAQAAVEALERWRAGGGKELYEIIADLRAKFPDLPSVDDGPENARAIAERRSDVEARRFSTLLNHSAVATERIKLLSAIVQRSTKRIDELNTALATATEDAKSLAGALAGIAPHVTGETCPVCSRDFSELGAGPLSIHIAAKIASLTNQAGRIQALASERATESDRLSAAQRDLLSAGSNQLSAEDYADFTVRAEQMSSAVQRLRALVDVSSAGMDLITVAAAAREALSLALRRDELTSSILPQIGNAVDSLTGLPVSSYSSVAEALKDAERILIERIGAAESALALRSKALSELEIYSKDLARLEVLNVDVERTRVRLTAVEEAGAQVDDHREDSKKVANLAGQVRSGIVKRVFNTSLNQVWRGLFVRLAPSEQFVPTFKLPPDDAGKVEAVLETLHRSGKSSGSPGAMLSQGNLNTAALTLFLALHLSVPFRLPWLVLDDPVQSMDDVHIAQFAALLRTLSKGMGRQLVIAVHERALFDYLTLELSPAFPGDSLISVEINKSFEGDAVAIPRAFSYKEDRAIAA